LQKIFQWSSEPKLSFSTTSIHSTNIQPAMADAQLYEDAFTITSVDPGKYDRVARVAGESQDSNTIITLDINTDLYPLATSDHIQLLLASTLNLDGSKDEVEKGWREIKGASLADEWDYVCHGKIYKFEEGDEDVM
jgi:DNA-directed RNA polymerase I, II, and III subunit RPABC3